MYPSKDLASNLLKAVTDDDSVTGTYKGNCYISKHIEVPSEDDLLFEQKGKKSLQNFMSNVKVYMFLYIIEGFDLPAKDLTGTSDPYLVIKVGTDTINVLFC